MRPVDKPYAVYADPFTAFIYHILKTYQTPRRGAESACPMAMCKVESPFTGTGYELGDVPLRDIRGVLLSGPDIVREYRPKK
jgi:hypothetical protein